MNNTQRPFEIIPAIDIIDGKLVRLTQGDYNQVESYNKSPEDMAQEFVDAGARRIHIVDLDGAKDGRLQNEALLKRIRERCPNVDIEFGGGIRTIETAQQLIDAGIDYIILGSLLIKDPETAKKIITSFPHQVILGIDAKNGMVATEGWLETSETSAVDLINQFSGGLLQKYFGGEVIYTDIAKDGTLSGPNIGEIKDIAANSAMSIIASGGVGTIEDIDALRSLYEDQKINVTGCIVGKAILSGLVPLNELWT
ncbi:1-(5-phosphoribosyl)-5-[(5-phosphoribosylamino)methylideneamino]imidazole-4-carboxamide isomerase [bacterium]|jgi:phosphoribosylformimino-5-aminoimidazole carboxamide ribotide isomerase|nr:1-(5-phosphoribosyl)-5-[(5-phosphoribosylamino)methylideneamino]imidazole-4-carboxamide isomerase [bacterium]